LVSNELKSYLESLIHNRNPIIQEIEEYAFKNNVPIMDLISVESILQFLRIIQPRVILEIGTAIGYSAIRMADVLPNTKIVTIERNKVRYEKALQFIEKTNKQAQIDVIFGDALEVVDKVKEKGMFDVLFIDAAKGQYKRFFENYEPVLSDQGVIITDNVLFKGLVVEENIENKRRRQLVDKIKMYNKWLVDHPDYSTTILPVGDGIAISKKRGVTG
jgi:predicted O-methyltransferase YrrM